MAHSHAVPDERLGPRLLVSIAINVAILTAQLVGGILAGSIALMADALHNLTDVVSLCLSYGALRVSKRPASPRYTFAFQRAEVIAAVLNAASLIIVSLYVSIEAIKRLATPEPVAGGLVMIFAAFGMFANAGAAWLLRGHRSNLNVRSAVLHLVSDSVASVGVLLGGALIYWFGWYAVDPIISLALAAWMVKESVGLLRTASRILMQGVPEEIELALLESAIMGQREVVGVHDLHVWAMTPSSIVLSAHIVLACGLSDSQRLAAVMQLKDMLHDEFGVEHATLESETSDRCAGMSCALPSAGRSYSANVGPPGPPPEREHHATQTTTPADRDCPSRPHSASICGER